MPTTIKVDAPQTAMNDTRIVPMNDGRFVLMQTGFVGQYQISREIIVLDHDEATAVAHRLLALAGDPVPRWDFNLASAPESERLLVLSAETRQAHIATRRGDVWEMDSGTTIVSPVAFMHILHGVFDHAG